MIVQVGDQAEQFRDVLALDFDPVLDDTDPHGDAAAGDICQVGPVGQELAGRGEPDVALDPDQHVGAADQPADPLGSGEVAVHDPYPVPGEQVRELVHGFIQELLLTVGLVPAGRPVHCPERGAGGGVGQQQDAQLRVRPGVIRRAGRPERGTVRRRCPASGSASRPPTPARKSPTSTAR